jgi:dipeptidyl aminopeptidase/acylaminoacyl peptidase
VTDRFDWGPSPVTPEALAGARRSFSGLQVVGDDVWWSQSRPADGGRQAVLRSTVAESAGSVPGPAEEMGPLGVSVRSRVHEYGGGAWVVDPGSGALFLVDAGDQAVWRLDADGSRSRVSGAAPEDESWRHGDLRVVPGGEWLVGVRERHRAARAPDRAVGVDDEIVALPTGRDGPPVVLVTGRDFVAAPRPSPDGARLAWVAWDHPDMPWDASELWVGELAPDSDGEPAVAGAQRLAGGPDESVGQPTWGRDGALWFVSDRRGWWQPYRWWPGAEPPVDPVADAAAEFHAPDWVLGQATLVPLEDGGLVARMRRAGRDRLVHVDPATSVVTEIEQPCVAIAAVAAFTPAAGSAGSARTAGAASRMAVLGATDTEPVAVHVVAWGADGVRHRSVGRPGAGASGPDRVSRAEAVTFATTGGIPAHLLFYPPAPGAPPPEPPSASGRPPLIVLCHGGPTGSAEPGFDLAVQFWTSRGVAVAAVDYRGSSGYGRDYRRLLQGTWGVADAEDAVAAAAALVAAGRVDGARLVVRGSSAGGFTALRAATIGGPFAAALVSYGVTDLEALARDTHKFESRYLDGLVGPWPECADRYAERSPARHPERIGAAVLLLQGEDDAVVPPDQAERMAVALRSRGLRCEHLVFPGEGHGFRRAETVAGAARAELAFLAEVFGPTSAGQVSGPTMGG